jgi:hypothetical protein
MRCFQNPEEWRYFTGSHRVRKKTGANRLPLSGRSVVNFDFAQ